MLITENDRCMCVQFVQYNPYHCHNIAYCWIYICYLYTVTLVWCKYDLQSLSCGDSCLDYVYATSVWSCYLIFVITYYLQRKLYFVGVMTCKISHWPVLCSLSNMWWILHDIYMMTKEHWAMWLAVWQLILQPFNSK